MKTFGWRVCAVLFGVLVSSVRLHADNPVIVHEWGTFTSLQDENGTAIGGINVDDEPVPGFVFKIAGTSVVPLRASDHYLEPGPALGSFGLPPYGSPTLKGWANGDPNVTMRLETPVLYIYPPKDQAPSSVPPLEVHVDFHGGVLSQFYPYATTNGMPLNGTMPYFQGVLGSDTLTGLTWKNVQLGTTGKLLESNNTGMKDAPPFFRGQVVETDDKVWTTPREVSAPLLQVQSTIPDGPRVDTITQSEHFLFYRGVGHLDSPIMVAPNGTGKPGAMEMGARWESGVGRLDAAWIADIREDGGCAFHAFAHDPKNPLADPLSPTWTTAGILWFPNFSDLFSGSDYSRDNLTRLQASMQTALIKAGLYPDEASAMLRTWELSYFKSPGLRFFYIVPRAWVDKTLPLTVTGAPVQITRVMVGRIELISEEQQAALARLAKEAYPDLDGLKKLAASALASGKFSKQEQADFYSGARPLDELGITLSDSVRDYLSLGRFRDALIVHAQAQHPSDNLARFIKENGLAAR